MTPVTDGGKIAGMSVTLSRQTEERIEEQLRRGRFASADELVRAAIEFFLSADEDEEPLTEQDVAELRAELQIGIDQLDRGEGRPWDAKEIWAEAERLDG